MVAEHRSIVPTLPGVPSWGAVLIAITFAAVGFAFDAGSGGKELTAVFAGAYVVGCIAAVLAVRQSGVFTAVIQPPLILFVTVPGAYFLFHGGTMNGVKDLLINCGYPLIERFPLMFFTSAVVLLIGMVRWYQGMSSRRAAPAEAVETEGRFAAVTSKISGLLARDSEDEDAGEAPAPRRSRQHSIDRASRNGKAAAGTGRTRSGRPVKRTQPSRSRHARPPETEIIEPVAERPRRHRTARRATEPTIPPAEPRRRSRARRRANLASNRRRVIADPPTNGPTGTAGSTASSRSNRTAPAGPTDRGRSTEPTTRSLGCAIEVPTTATSVRSTGVGRAPPGIGPTPGSTTYRRP